MEYRPVRISDIIRDINKDIYLPAIQREFVWSTGQIERLFDSVMTDFPIGSFLYWRLEERNKGEWPIYEFIRDFDQEHPHNPPASLTGINKDITLVLDGQQRIASLFIGLLGSYRYFYYRWRKARLYLDLLKPQAHDEDNPEELTFGFSFREDDSPVGTEPQLWYPAGEILNHPDAEDAKNAMEEKLNPFSADQQRAARTMLGNLHARIHTIPICNFYEERSQDYEKVLQIFVRANSAGEQLGYSDLLLSTATAKWENLDAREEIHNFTDNLNGIGQGYGFGKDFVLKSCLYLTENLPVQYKVKNFTRKNLRQIEENWENIKWSLTTTVQILASFGFARKNILAHMALLPIALYIMRRGNRSFDTSSSNDDAVSRESIRKWFVVSTLKGAFGGSSDTTLSRLRDLLHKEDTASSFPAVALYQSLGIEPRFNEDEINQILEYKYGQKATYLVLSLLYPNRAWSQEKYHVDHIFPKHEFGRPALKKRNYDGAKIDEYIKKCDALANLELLTATENRLKSGQPFDTWLRERDGDFKNRHLIPELQNYGMDDFEEFWDNARF